MDSEKIKDFNCMEKPASLNAIVNWYFKRICGAYGWKINSTNGVSLAVEMTRMEDDIRLFMENKDKECSKEMDRIIDKAREIENKQWCDSFMYKVDCINQNKEISKMKKSGEE